jgi:hypothetical protein
MENQITLKQLSEILEFGERAERELNKLFGTPAHATNRPTTSRPTPRSAYLGRKPAKN